MCSPVVFYSGVAFKDKKFNKHNYVNMFVPEIDALLR